MLEMTRNPTRLRKCRGVSRASSTGATLFNFPMLVDQVMELTPDKEKRPRVAVDLSFDNAVPASATA